MVERERWRRAVAWGWGKLNEQLMSRLLSHLEGHLEAPCGNGSGWGSEGKPAARRFEWRTSLALSGGLQLTPSMGGRLGVCFQAVKQAGLQALDGWIYKEVCF